MQSIRRKFHDIKELSLTAWNLWNNVQSDRTLRVLIFNERSDGNLDINDILESCDNPFTKARLLNSGFRNILVPAIENNKLIEIEILNFKI